MNAINSFFFFKKTQMYSMQGVVIPVISWYIMIPNKVTSRGFFLFSALYLILNTEFKNFICQWQFTYLHNVYIILYR